MHFLALSNVEVEFTKLGKLIWRSYTAAKALSTTNWVELIDKKEFARVILNENSEIFVMYIAALEVSTAMFIHLLRISQIQRSNESTLAAQQWDQASNKNPAKYSDYTDVFSKDLVIELPENIDINEYTIKLIEEKQPSYRFIYAFTPVELETLKAYIKTCF